MVPAAIAAAVARVERGPVTRASLAVIGEPSIPSREADNSVRTELAPCVTNALEDDASRERMRKLNAVDKDAVFMM